MNKANIELAYVLATMVVLFLFGVAAVAAFWRVWLKERRERDQSRPPQDPREDAG